MSTPTITPPAGPSAATGDVHVGGRRVVQYVVDTLLIWILPVALLLVVGVHAAGGPHRRHAAAGMSPVLAAGVWALGILMWLAVFLLVPSLTGRTPGMMLLGLRVVRADDGARPRATAHLVRGLCLIVDGFAFGLVGLVTMFATQRRQRVGDLAAGTLVVRDR